MRLRRGPREVYRVYGEDDAPDVDEWSGDDAPTQELAVECPQPAPTREFDVESRPAEVPTRPDDPEPAAPPSDEPRYKRQPQARLGQLRRVAVMTLLGVGVGLVAALALHSLRAPAGGDGRRAGRAGPEGAASWPSASPSVPVAVVPASAHQPRTETASVEGAGRERHAATSAEFGRAVRSRSSHGARPGHASKRLRAARPKAGAPAHLAAASSADLSALATSTGYGEPSTEAVGSAQPAAEAAQSEFTFER
jgi:hypothetical protein